MLVGRWRWLRIRIAMCCDYNVRFAQTVSVDRIENSRLIGACDGVSPTRSLDVETPALSIHLRSL